MHLYHNPVRLFYWTGCHQTLRDYEVWIGIDITYLTGGFILWIPVFPLLATACWIIAPSLTTGYQAVLFVVAQWLNFKYTSLIAAPLQPAQILPKWLGLTRWRVTRHSRKLTEGRRLASLFYKNTSREARLQRATASDACLPVPSATMLLLQLKMLIISSNSNVERQRIKSGKNQKSMGTIIRKWQSPAKEKVEMDK